MQYFVKSRKVTGFTRTNLTLEIKVIRIIMKLCKNIFYKLFSFMLFFTVLSLNLHRPAALFFGPETPSKELFTFATSFLHFRGLSAVDRILSLLYISDRYISRNPLIYIALAVYMKSTRHFFTISLSTVISEILEN